MEWLNDKWTRFIKWCGTFKTCYKESIGYTCYHRTYPDGTKECGEEPNLWGGDNE